MSIRWNRQCDACRVALMKAALALPVAATCIQIGILGNVYRDTSFACLSKATIASPVVAQSAQKAIRWHLHGNASFAG